MSALDQAEARRLQGVLARLASPHDGEVVAAAAAAARILGKAGMGFGDLVPQPVCTPSPPPYRPRADLTRHHQRRAMAMLLASVPWDTWERGFLESIRTRRAELTDGQRTKFDELCAKSAAWHSQQEHVT